MIGWVALGFALVSLALWTTLAVVAVLLWRKARPIVQAYAPMIGAMMPAAAGTEPKTVGRDSPSPAATPDTCEYGDHEWSAPQPGIFTDERDFHYCTRCGFKEPLPGQ